MKLSHSVILSFAFFLSLLSDFVHAEDVELRSETQAIEYITTLLEAETNEFKLLDKLASIDTLSADMEWKGAELRAKTNQIRLLLLIDDTPSAIELLPRAQALAIELNEPSFKLEVEVYGFVSDTVLDANNDPEDIEVQLLARIARLENPILSGRLTLQIANSQYWQGNYSDALKTYQLAYERLVNTTDVHTLAMIYSGLGNVNGDIDSIERAIEYYQKSLSILENTDRDFDISVVLYNLGNVYYKDQQFEPALKYLEQALQVSIKINDEIGVNWAVKRKADISIIQQKWPEAITMYESVVPTFVETENTQLLIEVYLGLARAYASLQQADTALIYTDKSKALLGENGRVFQNELLNKTLSLIYKTKGDYEKALEFEQKAYDLAVKRFTAERKNEVQKHRVALDTALKEKENKLLINTNELKTATIEKQEARNKVWILTFALALAFLVMTGMALRMQVKKRKYFTNIANMDELTGAANRRSILRYCEARFSEASSTITVGIIDLDHFKQINDTYGHKVGDEVLIAFAKACTDSLRQDDQFGRYGGEEWLICFNNNDSTKHAEIFNRIKTAWNHAIKESTSIDHELSFSMGIATSSGKDTTVEALINRADQNLYTAKENGRNQYVE